MERTDFEKLVEDAIRDVPEWFLEKLENIVVVVEDEPTPETNRRMGIGKGSTLLGLYEGVPLNRRGFYYGNVLPDKITLYRGPILRQGGDREEVAARVRSTVIHEIGHFFGLSDEELRKLERGG